MIFRNLLEDRGHKLLVKKIYEERTNGSLLIATVGRADFASQSKRLLLLFPLKREKEQVACPNEVRISFADDR